MRSLLLLILISSWINAVNLWVKKESYTTNESITVDVSLMSDDKQNWIGVYPVGSSNAWENVVSWTWTDGKGIKLSEITLPKTSKVGTYEVRAFFKNSFKVEGKSNTFTVKAVVAGKTELQTVNYYITGSCSGSASVSFRNMGNNSNDWIGLYPIGSSNAWRNVVGWSWIKNMVNGRISVPFSKNIVPGEYEFRAFFNNSFSVEGKSNPLLVTSCSDKIEVRHKIEYANNEPVKVKFRDDSNKKKNWIGIYKSGKRTLAENNLAWKWTDDKKEGEVVFDNLPAGEYDVRFFLNNSYTIEKVSSFVVKPKVTYEFPKGVLNGDNNPTEGVYVKYYKNKAYISVADTSVFAKKHKGITLVDYSDKENPNILAYNPNHSWGRFSKSVEFTENEDKLVFISDEWSIVSLTANNLVLFNSFGIGYANYQPALYKVDGHNLFYTVHSWAEQPKYRYYYVNAAGEITQVALLGSGGSDYDFLIDGGTIGEDKYYQTHQIRNLNTGGWKKEKEIYDISNLPEVVLLETIVFDVEP